MGRGLWIPILVLVPIVVQSQIIINEVMANPIDEDTGEFVELKNVGRKAVDLSDWQITDGDATDILQPYQQGTTLLPPNGLAVILDAEYAGQYDLPESAILLTTKNTTLGNGLQLNDPITLSNSQKQVVDTFTPTFKAKNGFSIERLSDKAANTKGNWQLSRNTTGATPGRLNSQNQIGSKPVNPDLALLVKIWINELLPAPNTKQGETEWIELFNPNPQVVDLSGWQITDASNKAIHLPVAVTIQPNGYLILSQKATAVQTSFAALNPSLIVELALPSLNNGGDTVTLKDRYQRQIDTVVYETSKSSRSMERVSVLEGVLQPSIDLDGGTPGKLNSLSQQISGQVELIIEPSSFDPLQHSTRIRYQAPFEAIITLQLFDAAGRKVRLLVDRQLAGGRQSIAWDGKNDAQEIVTVGIYICQIIAIVSSDKPAIRMAKPVIVAKQL